MDNSFFTLQSSSYVFHEPNSIENLGGYVSGELYPVELGSTFEHGRFRVVHKLGWGGYSTVWLARDEKLQKWVALKIATKTGTQLMHDRAVFTTAQAEFLHSVTNVAEAPFEIHGHDGTVYLCSVYKFLGPTVGQVIDDYSLTDSSAVTLSAGTNESKGDGSGIEDKDDGRFPAMFTFKLTLQLLRMVSSAHRAGIVHGDISRRNIVFEATKLQGLNESELLDMIGHPETAKLGYTDGCALSPICPSHVGAKVEWENWIDQYEEDIRLIDWDLSFDISHPPREIRQPHNLRAPETILTGHADQRSDLWQTGCAIWTFIFNVDAIRGWDGLLSKIDNFAEPFPYDYDWGPTKDLKPDDLRCEGKCKDDQTTVERSLQGIIDDPHLQWLVDVVKALMRIKPEDRISAEEAAQMVKQYIQHTWPSYC